jgi:predicted outer membrane repeat protein
MQIKQFPMNGAARLLALAALSFSGACAGDDPGFQGSASQRDTDAQASSNPDDEEQANDGSAQGVSPDRRLSDGGTIDSPDESDMPVNTGRDNADDSDDTVVGTPSPNQIGTRYFVNLAATAGGDGSNWQNALADLHEALALAETTASADNPVEIWAKEGVYLPTQDPTDRDATFLLTNHTKLYGSFAGVENSLQERDLYGAQYTSVLSGNIDGTPIDTDGKDTDPSGNTKHVLKGYDLAGEVLLDGWVIRHGNASASFVDPQEGAGLRLEGGAITLQQTRFEHHLGKEGGAIAVLNAASLSVYDSIFEFNIGRWGGAVSLYEVERVVFERCRFSENEAELSSGALHGTQVEELKVLDTTFDHNVADNAGAVELLATSFLFKRSRFISNTSQFHAGALKLVINSSGTIANSEFLNNSASGSNGGAIFPSVDSHPLIINTLFSGNKAAHGGALYAPGSMWQGVWRGNEMVVSGCTFTGNVAWYGGAMYVYGLPTISNSAFWGNDAQATDGIADIQTCTHQAQFQCEAHPSVIYSCIESGYNPATQGGIKHALVVPSDSPFLYDNLMGIDGMWGTDDDIDPILTPLGPCIDAGSISELPLDSADVDDDLDVLEPLPLDINGQHRVRGASVDPGAFETP